MIKFVKSLFEPKPFTIETLIADSDGTWNVSVSRLSENSYSYKAAGYFFSSHNNEIIDIDKVKKVMKKSRWGYLAIERDGKMKTFTDSDKIREFLKSNEHLIQR
ncbi:gp250 [Sphingomonas phage PAU]|uniref:gp250 n=1 Tax=Sphingomonas phage PAU TaxID=1150991 RepID=UPI0002573400|nr:gp250 [Sphingomonas phage PAU]AFF28248.1 gp250 [Sphingomonas phage PAU]